MWEGLDPGPRKDWSPWSSYSLFRHQVAIAVDHVKLIVAEVYKFDWIALALMTGIVSFLPARWAFGQTRSSISAWLVMTAVIYCLGFLAVAFETRYVIPILLPLAIALCFAESERFRIGWGGVAAASIYSSRRMHRAVALRDPQPAATDFFPGSPRKCSVII